MGSIELARESEIKMRRGRNITGMGNGLTSPEDDRGLARGQEEEVDGEGAAARMRRASAERQHQQRQHHQRQQHWERGGVRAQRAGAC
eukprot:9478049-Pyramimonas_sp.AAC.1